MKAQRQANRVACHPIQTIFVFVLWNTEKVENFRVVSELRLIADKTRLAFLFSEGDPTRVVHDVLQLACAYAVVGNREEP
jgi:hypothetical protein